MTILTLENAKWLIATLAIPGALAWVAHQYEQSQADRQISDARLRLYTELLSKREAADTDVRKGIFDKVLEKYLSPDSQNVHTKLVALDLLASNFHDSLDLSPLFWQLGREVERTNKTERTELTHQLIRIADGTKDRQISALELGTGDRGSASKEATLNLNALTNDKGAPDIDDKFSFPDPDPFAPSARVRRGTSGSGSSLTMPRGVACMRLCMRIRIRAKRINIGASGSTSSISRWSTSRACPAPNASRWCFENTNRC